MTAPINPRHPWNDLRHCAGWRLQQHRDGGFRIDDPHDQTRWRTDATSLDDALATWQQSLDRHEVAWRPGRTVVLLHGLGHQRRPMKPLAQALASRYADNTVRFEYSSCRGSLSQHARYLDAVVASLPVDQPWDLVAHSMGNLVTRRWFGLRAAGEATAHSLPERMVMLAPPNQGAALARRWGFLPPYRWLAGTAGQEIGPRFDSIAELLPAPPIPFGILAAVVPRWLINPLLPGPSDWIVRLADTPLSGATEYRVVPSLHAIMMRRPYVMDAAERFLRTGSFGIDADAAEQLL